MLRLRVAVTAALALSTASLTPLAAHAASSGGTTYYVSGSSTACLDSGPGTEAEPFCTLQAAAAAATAPGDTVLVGIGSYSGEVDITASGTAADPITFEPQPPTTATTQVLDEIGAGVSTYGLYLNGASYVDVTGFAFSGDARSTHSVEVENSSHVTLSQLSTTENVVVSGDSGNVSLSRIQIYGSSFDTSDPAIDVDASGTGDVISTNIVSLNGNGGAGIAVDGSADAAITSNTISDYCGAGITVGDDANGVASGATIENNVVEDAVTDANDEGSCASATSAGVQIGSAADESGLTADYNDVYPADSVDTEAYVWAGDTYQTAAALDTGTGQGAADSNANPKVYGDGLVANESSPVINAANSNAPGELATDFDGNRRVYDPNVPETGAGTIGYDRGADQFLEDLYVGKVAAPANAPSGVALTIGAPPPTDDWANATYTYVYDFGDGSADVTTSAASVTHTYATAGAYTITVTATSDFGASADDAQPISILKPVTFAATLTAAADFGLSVDPAVSVTTDWPVTSQVLNYGDGTVLNVTSTNDANLVHTYAEPGTYAVSYSVTDAGGDSTTVTKSFTTAGSDFSPITSARLLDTRKDIGGTSAELANDGSITLKVAGVDGIPADATAVDLNLTAVDATGSGYIEADTGKANGTSNLNYDKSLIYSNSVVAQIAPDGTVTLRNTGTAKAVKLDLIADATGYFAASQADRFDFVATSRIMDTLSGLGGSEGALGAGKTDVLTVAGVGGLPASGIAAVAVNLTVTDTTKEGYLVAYPDGTAQPGTSDVDWQGTTTKAANAIVPVGSDGAIDISNGSADGGATDVLVDVTGYFTASSTGNVYVPVAAARVLDTRTSSPIAAQHGLTLNLADVDGLPSAPDPMDYPYLDQSVTGYVFNATATDTEQPGWLLLNDGASGTGTSTVNWTGSGQTVANLAFTQDQIQNTSEGAGGYFVTVRNGSPSKPVQAIVDVLGYFTAS